MWGEEVITFKGATTKDAKTTALTPTISSSDANITVGACASTCSQSGYLISTADGKTAVLGSTTYYLAQPYQNGSKKYWKDAGSNFYGTFTIPSGYTYTIKGVNHALAAVSSNNFSATITVKDATTTKYSTGSLSVASKSSGALITSTAINIAEANWVVLSAGTYTINVTPANTADASTGKYFGMAEVALIGDLVESSADPVLVTGIAITPSPASVKVGKTITLTPAITPSNATDKAVTWAVTSGSSYASVTDAGVVSGLAVGTAVITATAHDGSGVTQTVTVNVEECPTSGTIFSMNITAPSGTAYTGNNTFPALIGATYVGGQAYSGSKTGTNRTSTINDSGEYPFSANSELAIKIVMDCPLEEGDIIDITTSSSRQIKIQKVVGTDLDKHKTASKTFTIPEESALIGENVFYLMRDNSESTLSSLTVTRPVFRTITLKYADGVTADGSISVVDGAPATKPTDPTWEHHRFDGWYNGETPYDWTANVTDDLALTARWTQLYTITYAAGDGTATGEAPTQVDKAEGETFAVAANTFEVAGKDFVKWNDGTNDYALGATYTVGTDNVVLTAQWKAAADKYTVIFKDGTTELGTKLFDVTTNPSDADIDKTKALNTFAAWQKEGVDIALDDAFWATVAKDAVITLTARWTPKYATSLDFAAITTAGTTGNNPIVDFLASGNMVASNLGGSEWETSTSKSGYVGYKLKNEGATITFLVQGGKRVMITFGSIGANVTLKKGEESVTISAASGDNAETVYPALDVATDMLITLTTTSGSTVTLKSITIGEIPAISDDATLQDLKVDGTTIAEFNSATKIYYFTVPYGTDVASMPKITNAEAKHGSASVVIYPTDGPEWTNEYGGCYLQQVVVTAEDGITKGYYHVRTTVDAKEGVTIIKATHTGATTADVIGAIGGTCDKNTQADGKLGSNGHYFGIKLAEGTFKSGDVIKVVASALNGGNTITLFADNEGTTEIGSVAYDQSTKTAYFTLTADVENVYIYRVSSACNSNVEYIEVQRFMDPFIETFEVAGTLGVVNQSTKTITIEVPASTDVTSLTPTIVAWANGGATVTPVGAQDFTNPVPYFVASAYAEDGVTTYIVTINKAAASTDATLQELTINGTAIPLVAGQYEYEYELPYGTTTAPEVEAEANDANATAGDPSVSLTKAVITVTAENGATQEYVINFTVSPWQNIVIWDGSTMGAVAASPDASGLTWEVNGFESIDNNTTTCGSKTYSKVLPSGGGASDSRNFKIVIPDGYLAKFYIAFASHKDGELRGMSIGTTINKNLDTSIYGAECSTRSKALGGTSVIVGAGTYYINPRASIDFCEVSVLLRPGYIRTGLTVGSLGTICLPSNVPAGQAFGATFYKLEGKEPQYGKIVFDEIPSGELEAGKPYLFQAQSDVLYCFYGTTIESDPINTGAMKGTFVDLELTELSNIYYFAQKALWSCVDLTSLSVPANRAYVDMDEMPAVSESNPAPGVRRITLGVNGQNTATGVENVGTSEQPMKMIIDGQLYIIRGEKMYDAQGKLVK